MRRGLLLAVALVLVVAVPAVARPVSVPRAAHAILTDKYLFPDTPQIDWCRVRRPYGTMCKTSLYDCVMDPAFGLSYEVDSDLVWVSRRRNGPVTDVPVAHLPTNVWPLFGEPCPSGVPVYTF